MSDLPVPAVLTILVLVLLVLIVLVVLGVRGRRGAEARQEGAATERSSGASAVVAEEPAEQAATPEDPFEASTGSGADDESASAAPPSGEAAGAGAADAAAADADPALSDPVDDDPRPWRERHGRRASRPLLSERSEARTAEEELAPAQNWERPQDGEAELRR